MATLREEDVMASIETRLVAAWPETAVSMILFDRDAPANNSGTAPVREIVLQSMVTTPRPTRAGEDWWDIDFRAVCYSTVNDPHDAHRMADDLREVLRNAHWNVVDRTDGTTVVGYVQIHETEVQPAGRDRQGRRVAACRAIGWAGTI